MNMEILRSIVTLWKCTLPLISESLKAGGVSEVLERQGYLECESMKLKPLASIEFPQVLNI